MFGSSTLTKDKDVNRTRLNNPQLQTNNNTSTGAKPTITQSQSRNSNTSTYMKSNISSTPIDLGLSGSINNITRLNQPSYNLATSSKDALSSVQDKSKSQVGMGRPRVPKSTPSISNKDDLQLFSNNKVSPPARVNSSSRSSARPTTQPTGVEDDLLNMLRTPSQRIIPDNNNYITSTLSYNRTSSTPSTSTSTSTSTTTSLESALLAAMNDTISHSHTSSTQSQSLPVRSVELPSTNEQLPPGHAPIPRLFPQTPSPSQQPQPQPHPLSSSSYMSTPEQDSQQGGDAFYRMCDELGEVTYSSTHLEHGVPDRSKLSAIKQKAQRQSTQRKSTATPLRPTPTPTPTQMTGDEEADDVDVDDDDARAAYALYVNQVLKQTQQEQSMNDEDDDDDDDEDDEDDDEEHDDDNDHHPPLPLHPPPTCVLTHPLLDLHTYFRSSPSLSSAWLQRVSSLASDPLQLDRACVSLLETVCWDPSLHDTDTHTTRSGVCVRCKTSLPHPSKLCMSCAGTEGVCPYCSKIVRLASMSDGEEGVGWGILVLTHPTVLHCVVITIADENELDIDDEDDNDDDETPLDKSELNAQAKGFVVDPQMIKRCLPDKTLTYRVLVRSIVNHIQYLMNAYFNLIKSINK